LDYLDNMVTTPTDTPVHFTSVNADAGHIDGGLLVAMSVMYGEI